MGLIVKDDGWRMPDKMWEKIEPLLPPGEKHPLGCHNPPTPPRKAMDGILFVLRTGCQWNALTATGICTSSSAHRWFQKWVEAGVFEKFWKLGLQKYDERKGINWAWLSMDGTMTKAPLGGKKTGPNPTDRAKSGVKRSMLTDAKGIPLSVEVDKANRHDMKLAKPTLKNIKAKRPKSKGKKSKTYV